MKVSKRFMFVLMLMIVLQVNDAQSQENQQIAESEIVSLETQYEGLKNKGLSTVRRRRACKNIIRKITALITEKPDAGNRFKLLFLELKTYKQLLDLDKSERNIKAFYACCEKILNAPDKDAYFRVDADILLLNRALALKDAGFKEREKSLFEFIERYRDTGGEAKSLMVASRLALKIESARLESEINNTMNYKFANDPGMLEFRKKYLSFRNIQTMFTGTYQSVDGSALDFPIDLMGQQALFVFWSKEKAGYEEYLQSVKKVEEKHPNYLKVFSFNLDELADGGQAQLKALNLNWTALHLPGGRKNQAFASYAPNDQSALFVNAFGLSIHKFAMRKPVDVFNIQHGRMSHPRYIVELQSFFIGDFLVTETNSSSSSLPAEKLAALKSCFVKAPMRFRQSPRESLAGYQRAEKLCRELIGKHPKDKDLWMVRHHLIVSLLGMWKIKTETKFFEQAVEESKKVLAEYPQQANKLVPYFCLTKQAMRQKAQHFQKILEKFVEESGGKEPGAEVLAAAAILAIEASSKRLHEVYRLKFERLQEGKEPLGFVDAFFSDRYHRFHLLKANYIRHESNTYPRGYIIQHEAKPTYEKMVDFEVKKLDGKKMMLPKKNNKKMTLLLFVELPADKKTNLYSRHYMSYVNLAIKVRDHLIHKELELIFVFLSDDAKKVAEVIKANKLDYETVLLPGGLNNPVVKKLGIYSADIMANPFLLRRDNSVAWHARGFKYNADYSSLYSKYLAIMCHTEAAETQSAVKALKAGQYEEAKHIFSGPFLPERDDRYHWTAPRFHGRAVAEMYLKNWEAALEDINKAVAAHEKSFRHDLAKPCTSMLNMYQTRFEILKKLGQTNESKLVETLANAKATAYKAAGYRRPYTEIHVELGNLVKELK